MLYSVTKLLSYFAIVTAALASQDATQVPIQHVVPQVRYVECAHAVWSGRMYDCGQVDVPLDWNNPGLGSITLNFTALAVQRRVPRKGVVFYHSGHEYLGRRFDPYLGIDMMLGENKQIHEVVSEYDLVAWTSRESAIAERTRCFALDDHDKLSTFPRDPFGAHESEQMAFYNTTFRRDLGRLEPPWDGAMAWTRTQGPDDVKDMLYAQEKLVAHCLSAPSRRNLYKYIGTAATARDLAALADALDGRGSPINIWTKHHGSLVATHLLKMFPKRIGRVVMDDPVDPVTYQTKDTHKQWVADIAMANSIATDIKRDEMRNDSSGYMQFSGNLVIDEVRMDNIIKFLHSELVEWHTRSEAEGHMTVQRKEHSLWSTMDYPRDFVRKFLMHSPRQRTGVNGWRGSGYRSVRDMSVLDGMPLVCGDALYDHDTGTESIISVRAELEAFLIDNMYTASLIASSVFPPLRFLCHLWPVRAAERVYLGGPYESLNKNAQVLILLRDKDYWNYFSVTEELARERWHPANVVAGLHYGDLVWDHDQCSVDIVKAFYSNGTLPAGPHPCRCENEGL